jgi:hypothetical protein
VRNVRDVRRQHPGRGARAHVGHPTCARRRRNVRAKTSVNKPDAHVAHVARWSAVLTGHSRIRRCRAIFPTDTARTIALGSAVLTVFPQPPEDREDENDNSIGIRLRYGSFAALLTGDSEAGERAYRARMTVQEERAALRPWLKLPPSEKG